ncbi:MAG: esterase/lipase family protein [Aquincola tertiaricarbonis]
MKSRFVALLLAVLPALLPASCHADGYTRTRHPIVLVHGLFGFERLFGTTDYFYGIPEALRAGGAQVLVVQLSPANDTVLRGEALLRQLQWWQATYGHARFNLIGHSQGGSSARYVAAVAPALVASVTTIGTPHQGSASFDAFLRLTGATGTTALGGAAVGALGGVVSLFAGSAAPIDGLAAAQSLSSRGAQAFNRLFPQGAPSTPCGQGPAMVNGVRYYAFGGRGAATNLLDATDAILVTGATAFLGAASDGLVSPCSSRWGQVIRDDLPWNHFDQVNQSFGLRGLFTPDPVAVYRAHANRLKGAGL